MIIKRLTMNNFGVYEGENTFEFSYSLPVVLIGGMNGRGKTTFLEAILLALYGENSKAYKESKYKTYGQYLRSYVNKNSWTQRCFIELDFILNERDSEEYLIRREWNALSKRTSETLSVQWLLLWASLPLESSGLLRQFLALISRHLGLAMRMQLTYKESNHE